MGESEDDDELFWVKPLERGIIPLDGFHLSRSMRRLLRKKPFEIRIDHDFAGVIEGCGSLRAGRVSTWINEPLRQLYGLLFDMGYCHTIETWRDDQLVGGLYGVAIGAAFFGESMFSYEQNASKVALTHLVARLNHGGFTLLDTQFVTDHLQTMGAVEISHIKYAELLNRALELQADFLKEPLDLPVQTVLQLVSHTSNTGCSTP